VLFDDDEAAVVVDGDRLRPLDAVVLRHERVDVAAVGGQQHDAIVPRVAHDDVVEPIAADAVRVVELVGAGALAGAELPHEVARRVEDLHHVLFPVGDDRVAVGRRRHIAGRLARRVERALPRPLLVKHRHLWVETPRLTSYQVSLVHQRWNWVTFCDPVTRESSDPETQLTRFYNTLQMSTYVAEEVLSGQRSFNHHR